VLLGVVSGALRVGVLFGGGALQRSLLQQVTVTPARPRTFVLLGVHDRTQERVTMIFVNDELERVVYNDSATYVQSYSNH